MRPRIVDGLSDPRDRARDLAGRGIGIDADDQRERAEGRIIGHLEGHALDEADVVQRDNGVAYYGTFANDVVAVDIAAKKVRWRFMDPDRQFPYYSSAALANGLVVLGGRDKNVPALDMATGKQRWVFPTRARVESSPAVVGTRVIVGSSDGKLYVLDLTSGKKLWEFEAGAPFTASPAVSGGRVVFGDGDGRLYSLGQ